MLIDDAKFKIKEKGYWEVIIEPSKNFIENNKINLEDLENIIKKSKVSLRGWSYPYYFEKNGLKFVKKTIKANYINEEDLTKKEYWEFTESGIFGNIFSIREDYDTDNIRKIAKQNTSFDIEKLDKVDNFLNILEVIYRVTEIFLFAKNLASLNIYSDSNEFLISIKIYKPYNRALYVNDTRGMRELFSPYICEIDEDYLIFEKNINKEELILNYKDLARDVILDLFQLFNWDKSQIKIIEEDQKRLLERRLG